jgi:AraC-like DNA-binding protein
LATAFGEDGSWSSSGLGAGDAISQWRQWASRALAPIDVLIPESGRFTAQWHSRGLGPLRFVQIGASAQHVIHADHQFGSSSVEPTFQLVYSRRGAFETRTAGDHFVVSPGEFVLLDNSRFYQMDMNDYHEAIDLVMPQAWLERWLPDPQPFLDRPIPARHGWASPLGSLLDTMADHPQADLPRHLMADQLGSLLSLLGGFHVPASRHRTRLTQRILKLIAQNYADPDLTVDSAARELGISKRYVHTLLARRGTSFVRELNSVRIERGRDLLSDPRAADLPIAEIAFRTGFLDPGYFTRLFRKRFGLSPRNWRASRS